jgi:hypothetical protein
MVLKWAVTGQSICGGGGGSTEGGELKPRIFDPLNCLQFRHLRLATNYWFVCSQNMLFASRSMPSLDFLRIYTPSEGGRVSHLNFSGFRPKVKKFSKEVTSANRFPRILAVASPREHKYTKTWKENSIRSLKVTSLPLLNSISWSISSASDRSRAGYLDIRKGRVITQDITEYFIHFINFQWPSLSPDFTSPWTKWPRN